MQNRITLKRNKFSYVYDAFSETLYIQYGGYDYAEIDDVKKRQVQSRFNQAVEKIIRDARNETQTSTGI